MIRYLLHPRFRSRKPPSARRANRPGWIPESSGVQYTEISDVFAWIIDEQPTSDEKQWLK